MAPIPVVLTIAGSDSSGGAGIQADMKTICALGGYGCVALTAVTAQNTRGVDAVEYMSPGVVAQQIRSVAEDYPIDAVKIGMVGSSSCAKTITRTLGLFPPGVPVVWDPVMVASSGSSLVDADSEVTSGFVDLARRADVVTPNGRELVDLCDMVGVAVPAVLRGDGGAAVVPPGRGAPADGVVTQSPGMGPGSELLLSARAEAAAALSTELGTVVVATGGPDNGFVDDGVMIMDVVAQRGDVVVVSHDRVDTANTHGTGCTLSSAIAVCAARSVCGPEKDGVDAEVAGPGHSMVSAPHGDVAFVCDWRSVVEDAAAWTCRALGAADALDCALGLRRRQGGGVVDPVHGAGNAPVDHFWAARCP